MYPTIHSYQANDLSMRGYGTLSDAFYCEVTEELNGEYTLEMEYPASGICAEHLVPDNIIMAVPNHQQKRQPFRIHQVKEILAGRLSVYANHISYDLSGYPRKSPAEYTSLADVIDALENATYTIDNSAYRKFHFYTDFELTKDFAMAGGQTVRSWMGGQEGSILDTYGGEWEYDNFNCFLLKKRGQDHGVRVSYGVNLAEYESERDSSQYSHVIAFWADGDNRKFSSITSTGVECPYRVVYVDVSKNFENIPSVAELNTVAQAYISDGLVQTKSIIVTPAQLKTVVGMGDTVTVTYKNRLKTRVIKTVWNVLTDKYTLWELGDKRVNITDTIKNLANDKKINPVNNKDIKPAATLSQMETVPASDSISFTVPKYYRGILYAFRGSTSMGQYMVYCTSAGAVSVCEISSVSTLTLTTGTNSLTIANSSNAGAYIFAIGNKALT